MASSTLLASSATNIQGRADALGWTFAAMASESSGVLVAKVGYPMRSSVGLGLALMAAALVATTLRSHPDPVPA